MKKIVLLFLSVAFFATTTFAQPPRIKNQKEYGGLNDDGLRSLCTARDGGLLVGGYSTSDASGNKRSHNNGLYDMWIIKQDSLGKKQWERALGGYGDEVLTDQKATPDGGYILCGFSTSNVSGEKKDPTKGGYDYWVVKIDSLGKVQWDRSLGGSNNDLCESVDLTTDGGYIVAGFTISAASGDITENSFGNSDTWVAKLDASGNLQWQNRLGGSGQEGNDVISVLPNFNFHLALCRQAPDGGYLIATTSSSNISGDKTANAMGSADYWIVKLDASGNQVWDKTIGGSGTDFIEDLRITQDGGFIACGYSNSPVSGNKTAGVIGRSDYWIVKMDATGNVQWDKTIGGFGYDAAQSILQTSNGDYVVSGFSDSKVSGTKTTVNKGSYDYWVVKIDNTGNVLWDRTIGGQEEDYATALVQDSPNSYVIGGESNSYFSGNKTETNYGRADYWGVQLVEYAAAPTSQSIAGKALQPAAALNTHTLLVYPNPATTVLHIQNAGKTPFVLTDLSGKRMLSKTINGNGDLNVANIPSGTYYLTNITTASTQKVIITR